MTEKIARQIGPDKIDIAYACYGNPDATPLLLITGIGTQLLGWPRGFIDQLVSNDLYVVCLDNRDVGLSSHLHEAPTPDLPAVLAGDYASVSYRLANMAADVVALMDELGIPAAHLLGLSMGGFIAQTLAINHPERVRSLTSMLSTTGDINVGQAHPEATPIFHLPPPTNREEAMDNAVTAMRVIGSPGFELDVEGTRLRAGLAYDRCYDLIGVMRQAVATVASGDRTEQLESLTVPTLVIHGDSDKMCDVSGGEATAAAIPDAKLEIIAGMGHSLPIELWPRLSKLIAEHITAAKARNRGT